eukprot:801690-Pelagomonas_calceolata.AAC.3
MQQAKYGWKHKFRGRSKIPTDEYYSTRKAVTHHTWFGKAIKAWQFQCTGLVARTVQKVAWTVQKV